VDEEKLLPIRHPGSASAAAASGALPMEAVGNGSWSDVAAKLLVTPQERMVFSLIYKLILVGFGTSVGGYPLRRLLTRTRSSLTARATTPPTTGPAAPPPPARLYSDMR